MSDTYYEQIDRETLFDRKPTWLRWNDIPNGATFYTRLGLAYEKTDRGVASQRYDWDRVDQDDADESDVFDDFPYFAADVTPGSDDMD